MTEKYNKFMNSTVMTVIAFVGYVASLISFVLAIVNENYVVAVLFFIASLYCFNHFATYIRNKKKNNRTLEKK